MGYIKESVRGFYDDHGNRWEEVTEIIGYGSNRKVGDKYLVSTKEEMEENDRQFAINLEKAKQWIEEYKQEQELKQKKLKEQELKLKEHEEKEHHEHLRRILFDEEYLDETLNIAIENKWIEVKPIENDLLPFEEFINRE